MFTWWLWFVLVGCVFVVAVCLLPAVGFDCCFVVWFVLFIVVLVGCIALAIGCVRVVCLVYDLVTSVCGL